MSNFPLLGLPVDMVERFIIYMPDYVCLWSFVTSGRTIYQLFHSRRDWYMHAIGENQVGEALYYARYLARHTTINCVDQDDLTDWRNNLPNSNLLSSHTPWHEQPPMLFKEASIVSEFSKTLQGLEAHYSNLSVHVCSLRPCDMYSM